MSAVSIWEKFLGTDWERYSQASSKITCVVCALVGLLSILFGFNIGVGLWSIFSALLLAVWEFPSLFAMVPNFERLKDTLLESFKLEEMRALLYFGLSIFCFFGSLCVISGLALLVSACLQGFSAVNRRVDTMDRGAEGSHDAAAGSYSSPASVPYQQRSANNAFVNSSDDTPKMNNSSQMTSLLPK
ncbi:hypothetical protein B484DRAFT_441319 [Ochromonadaceae sp. CCMP2298]|nr:hypothetical protein B484DRAFT_441319 [Ochromonadaceae sp. CCMP2298]